MTLQDMILRQQQINTRMAEIRTRASAEDVTSDELTALRTESEGLVAERGKLDSQIAILRNEITNPETVISTPVQTIENRSASSTEEEDPYSTIAYRTAFKDWVLNKRTSPALSSLNTRGAVTSTTSDNVNSVIIPTTVTEKLFKRNERAGYLFGRVRKTNYPAGMKVPTSNIHPRLEWVAENTVAKKTGATTDELVFTAHKGQIRFAISLESQVMTLDGFEEMLVEKILEGCEESFDEVIVIGDGVGKPKGILTCVDYEKKAVKMNNVQIEDYSYWIKIYSKIPLKMQSKSQLHINKVDWQAHVLGMKDTNGKVIALETMGFGGELKPIFMGREVILLEDQGLPTFDSLTGSESMSKATAFAYFSYDDDYWFNSNMQLTLRDYIDEETDERVFKATILCDGKEVDDEGLLVVCRDVDAAEKAAE